MTEKFKKIDRQYVLSDSSVNVYGFRLLTSGYQLDAYQKNPIGYYMHRREDGIALKWDDLHVENDQVVGTPVINLANTRGPQTCEEAENGFLNAASMGHIVVLEYSTDPEMMLPGQTGPTITKWYNKECSLVDIPGNNNALTALYDASENEIKLADLSSPGFSFAAVPTAFEKDLCELLNLSADAGQQGIKTGVAQLAAQSEALTVANAALKAEKEVLAAEVVSLKATQSKQEIDQLLTRALEDRKLTVALKQRLAVDYAANPTGLKELLAAMPAYQSITDRLKANNDPGETVWTWDDYEKNDPSGKKLKALRADNPEQYQAIFKQKFAA